VVEYLVPADVAEAAAAMKGYSTTRIDGIPVLMYPQDEGGPGSIEFHLRTANSNAVTIAVIGNKDLSDLEAVSESIVGQWLNANPVAASSG
jgi:hypothetical protein